jgi:ATP-dependent DNA helicase RecQ
VSAAFAGRRSADAEAPAEAGPAAGAPAGAGRDATPAAVLARVFGFAAFRGEQAEVVAHVMRGGDALVLMPTGGGKSLCYQIPALCLPGTAIVVSPLIALMDDQVAALRQLGVAAAALHSELDPDEARAAGRALDAGQLDIVYVSPERLLSPGTLERLRRRRVALLAIDEAHCVSQWGHEFRPEYRMLATLADAFPGVPRLALTATADPRTRDDILASLRLDGARVFAASFHRPNLHLAAEPKERETERVVALARRHPSAAGIVYCGSRTKTERVAAKLVEKGVPAVAFHAGLPAATKRAAAAKFRAGEGVVVVATIAFGMGIDRPDVRFVVHLDMPASPEAYYQQIGRAGRDGEPAETLLLYNGEDIARARHFLNESAAPEAQRQVMRQRLEAMIALTETAGCRTASLLACFGETLAAPCGHCDTCARPVHTFDGSIEAQKLISAVVRTGQRFGALHVISVLLGEATDAVRQWRHNELPTFGVGRDRSRDFWRGVVRQLIAQGVLTVESGRFATLTVVTERAREILRGTLPVLLRASPAARSSATPRQAVQAAPAEADAATAGAFAALRAWRGAEARTQGVPPYVIFHDTVLRDIAQARPLALDELGQVRGVGASKLLRYGEAVIKILRDCITRERGPLP